MPKISCFKSCSIAKKLSTGEIYFILHSRKSRKNRKRQTETFLWIL